MLSVTDNSLGRVGAPFSDDGHEEIRRICISREDSRERQSQRAFLHVTRQVRTHVCVPQQEL
jgi:hypothetical protein